MPLIHQIQMITLNKSAPALIARIQGIALTTFGEVYFALQILILRTSAQSIMSQLAGAQKGPAAITLL